ncbi:magnesium transporter [Sulfurimonas gotlandica GD1]|uniref:Magnesium transporter MgtE n=1 Tax=Sulfurimonas gotlandica (strain DSM 19862 / JCM 16533 / GD1) TaxID=929558 RepID=B6BJY9_SULGG|nr:magnesium transporter [Sulfurimonas gotlandica]EDZ62487.1 magnesium transporter [Sulfurimonas gotlandica GD1]EHP31393.1 magnesium transporter [Sulfurimonas gotlandica GD1]
MEINQEELTYILNILDAEINQYKESDTSVHPYDIAEQLLKLRELSSEEYEKIIKKMPHELFAEVLSELPDYVQEETADIFSVKKLANIASLMDTDDAATLIQNISEEHEEISQDILGHFDDEDKELMKQLISYEWDEAGSYMQTELFSAKIDENIGVALERLKVLKISGEVDNIWHVHLVNERDKYLGSVGLEDLIIFDHALNFEDIPYDKHKNYSVNHKENIKDVVEKVTNYNLNAIAVLDNKNRLIGRITSDDIYDIIEETATEQIFNLAGVNDEAEQDEDMFQIGKTRAIWLGLNLLTAIAASLVIGMFDATIQSLVALAILMPIVASMGGNAGTQTLTVTVRQMALGDIEGEDAKKTIYKEVVISLVNGTFFAIVIGIIAYFWFNMPMLGVVIGLSMIINLLGAGFFGSVIPLVLQRAGVDPAIGSSVLLTTVTDIVGFFSFLGLASIILL